MYVSICVYMSVLGIGFGGMVGLTGEMRNCILL